MRKLQLERPICFFDLETTSADKNSARIIEIAICKISPDGWRKIYTQLVNPGESIPAESSKIHGITDADVKDKPLFEEIASEVFDFIDGCDMGGYNSNQFDVPILFREFARAKIAFDYRKINMIDVCNIFKIKEQRTLSAAYQFYTSQELINAHSAEADILATVEVFEAQLNKYPDLPLNVAELATLSNYGKESIDLSNKFTRDADGDLCFTFGKNKGMKCKEHKDFLKWMLTVDFTDDVKMIAKAILADQKV